MNDGGCDHNYVDIGSPGNPVYECSKCKTDPLDEIGAKMTNGTVSRGRPPKGEGEKLVHVSIRIPPEVMEHFSRYEHPSAAMREALEAWVEKEVRR